MAFSSKLYPGETIINDSTPEHLYMPPPDQSRGLILPMRAPGQDYIYEGTAEPFPSELLIPPSEYQARIQEAEEKKYRLSDLVNQAGLPCKDQARTNYCWINAPTHCVEIIRVLQHEEMVILSPASVGAQLTDYKNIGGWGGPGLIGIARLGLVPVDKWPANAIDRRYATPENAEIAKSYRQTEWWELRPRNKAEQVSLLLRGFPLAVGQNHWSHEVTQYECVWLDGEVAIRFRNSWTMDWPKQGAMGYSIQQGSKMLADDAVSPRVAVAA